MAEVGGKVDLMRGPIQDPGNSQAPQDDEETQELKMILGWMDDAKRARKKFDADWETYWNAYKGETWKSEKGTGSKERPELNIIRAVIQTILPILTDTNPGFNVIPQDPGDFEFASMLGDAVDSLWERQSMQIKIVEVLMDQSVLPVGILKVRWNPMLEDGAGDVEIEVKDPRNIWLNPEALDFDRDCKYVIERLVKSVGEWKRQFPEKVDQIRGDSESDARGPKDTTMPADGKISLVSPTDRDSHKDVSPQGGGGRDNLMAEGWEVWYIDETTEEYLLECKDGAEPEKGYKKKFPNGHLTTVLPNQKLILQSVENPNQGPNFNPYTKFIDTIMPHQFYGEGEVSPLLDIQKGINKTAQSIFEYLRLMANPVWIIDKTAGVDTNKLTNKVGLIIMKEAGTEVTRSFPEALPSTVFEFFNLLMRLSDIVSGIQDVSQGRKPTGVTAAQAIDTLLEAAQTRIRLKERTLDTSLSKLARLTVAMMLQNYRGPRYQKVAGDKSSAAPAFVEFAIEDGVEGGYQINRRKIVFDPNQGRYITGDLQTAQSSKSLFDVKVKTGTALPFEKEKRANVAFKLFEAQAIDQEELLTAVDWANKEQVMQRMSVAAAQAQAQQAAAATAQPVQPPKQGA